MPTDRYIERMQSCCKEEILLNDRIRLALLYLLPKNALSRTAGRFAGSKLSRWLIPYYAKTFQIDVSQAEKPIEAYQNLTDFFIRRLKSGLRPIEDGDTVIVSPVDGVVSQFGKVENGTLLQAKGVSFSLLQLLGSQRKANDYEGGTFVTLYLSPRDYHRIHAALSGQVVAYSYIPGSLFPVNPFGVRTVPGLLARNERLITYLSSSRGEYAVVKVGATMVGSVQVVYDDQVTTNVRGGIPAEMSVNGPVLEKGDELGWFRFGSTVILLFQSGMAILDDLQEGQFVQMGQRIGEVRKNN
jgi:phosphatidylserine decarboxylase